MIGVGSGCGGGGGGAGGSTGMPRRGGGGWVRWCLVMFAVISALCVSAPALYWKFHLNKPLLKSTSNNQQLSSSSSSTSSSSSSTSSSSDSSSSFSCPPCSCDCPPPPSLLQIAPGLANLSVTDCGSSDPDLKKEMAKQFVDLLTEELKLQEGVAAEHAQHMNATLTEARRVASQYQREGDKCIAATETCEGARERSEALLRKEIKLTSLWERRARKLGWEAE